MKLNYKKIKTSKKNFNYILITSILISIVLGLQIPSSILNLLLYTLFVALLIVFGMYISFKMYSSERFIKSGIFIYVFLLCILNLFVYLLSNYFNLY